MATKRIGENVMQEQEENVPWAVIRKGVNLAGPSPTESDQWQHIVDLLRANYENPDIQAARLICSAVAAHALKRFSPAWVLAIAPPGSMKTDLLESLRELPNVHFVDEITTKTFISGKVDEPGIKRTRPASWLHRIGSDGIVVAADFSTFTADPKSLQVILAQLRRIYDGNYAREFGTDENGDERSWKGRLTLFAGAVPDIDRHYHLFQKLGERFLRLRWPRAGGVQAALRAMHHTTKLAPQLQEAVHGLLQPLLLTPGDKIVTPALDSSMEIRVANLSELTALARSHVERDQYSREVIAEPITEGNTRLPQQLCQIARGSALIDRRQSINESDFGLLCRAALDSLPPARRTVLETLVEGNPAYSTALPSATAYRALEELQLVGLVKNVGNRALEAELTGRAQELLREARIVKP
jgi:hypothetical protein